MHPTIRMVPGHVLIPSRRAKAFIVVEPGQRWRTKNRRRPAAVVEVIRKVDGRAFYLDPSGRERFMACEDLRRRYVLEESDS